MESQHQRFLFLLLALFAVLHCAVHSLSASCDRFSIAFSGNVRELVSYLVACVYPLVAHLLIAAATWFGVRGWHGLFVATSLVFLYHVVDPNLIDIHNLADLILQTRFGWLVYFDETIFRLLVGFAVALAFKPWFLAIRRKEPSRVQLELSDILWIAVACALVGVGFRHFQFNQAAPWKTVEFVGASIMVCGAMLVRYRPRYLGGLCTLIGGLCLAIARMQLDKTILASFQAWWG